MAVPRVYFQAHLEFLVAVSRDEETLQGGIVHCEFKHRPGQPIRKSFDRGSNAPKSAESQAMEDIKRELDRMKLDSWTLEFDEHLHEYHSNQYEWVGFKLTSPEYRAGEESLDHHLETVLGILNESFIAVANSDTRLGVTVRLAGLYVNLDQLKAIASMIWMVDPLLSEIHPPHCGPNALRSLGLQYTNLVRDYPLHLKTELAFGLQVDDPWNNYLSPNRHPLEMLLHPGELTQARYQHGADRIFSANSIEDLIHLLEVKVLDIANHPRTRSAYGFQCPRSTKHLYLNFNQHYGTLNLDEIKHWTSLCVGMFMLCVGNPPALRPQGYPGLRYTSDIFAFLEEHNLINISNHYKSVSSNVADLGQWSLLKSTLVGDESKPIVTQYWPSNRLHPSPLAEFGIRALNWENSPKVTGNSRYSFGIELEMYVPKMPQDLTRSRTSQPSASRHERDYRGPLLIDFESHDEYHDPHPEDDRKYGCGEYFGDVVTEMANYITSKGLLTMYHSGLSYASPEWIEELNNHGRHPIKGIEPAFQTWTVENDASLMPWNDWAGYQRLMGLEITSPILRDTPKGWEEALEMVGILRNNYRLAVTTSCGFHIHVGKGTEPLPFHLLRKISVVTYCAENMIYRLCHPSRRSQIFVQQLIGKSNLDCSFTDAWADMDVSGDFEQYIPVDRIDRHVLGCLKKLWATTTVTGLQGWLKPHDNTGASCVKISQVGTPPDGTNDMNGTFEFRYLEGTLDPELIIRWSQLMVSLFQFADLATSGAWKAFLPTVLQCRDAGPCDLNVLRMFLMFLGLDSDYDYWANRTGGQQLQLKKGRPSDDHEIQSRISEAQINVLQRDLCQRQRTLPCLASRERPSEGPKSPTGPESRAKSLLRKCDFTGEQVETALESANEVGLEQIWAQAELAMQSQEESLQGGETHLIELLRTSRIQAKEDLESYNDN
ncbi:hypothetical protein ACHAPU_005231 [Fusarium lateritium]